mmetsp:Transcript_49591/g.103479  ORF Transcript_49591/g.103479 Transcript_49591/m.103479 type:complete len:125 (-) Transcript_49591:402-776(-)
MGWAADDEPSVRRSMSLKPWYMRAAALGERGVLPTEQITLTGPTSTLGMEVDRKKPILKLKISPIRAPWMAAIIAGRLLHASCRASKYSHVLLLNFTPAIEKQELVEVSRQYRTTRASTIAFGP